MTGLEFIMGARSFAGERTAAPAAILEIGRRIVNHEVVGGASAEAPFSAGEQIYAHTSISGHGANRERNSSSLSRFVVATTIRLDRRMPISYW